MRLRFILFVLAAVAIVGPAYSQAANTTGSAAPVVEPKAPAGSTLQDGTAVKLRLAETITSASAKVGQQVPFEVIEEVDVDGLPVIAKGAQAVA